MASVLAARLGLSAIPIFILAGILLGPSPGFPSIIEPSEGIDLLARLGIVLLLFFLGLEFSLDRIMAARRMVLVGGPARPGGQRAAWDWSSVSRCSGRAPRPCWWRG